MCCIYVLDSFDGFGAVRKCTHDFVIWSDCGVSDVLVLELDRVAESITASVLDVALVSAIMLR